MYSKKHRIRKRFLTRIFDLSWKKEMVRDLTVLWLFLFFSIFLLSFFYYESTLWYIYSIQYVYISFGYYMNIPLSCIRFPIFILLYTSLYIYIILNYICRYKFHLYSLHYYFLCFSFLSFSFIYTLADFCQTKPNFSRLVVEDTSIY